MGTASIRVRGLSEGVRGRKNDRRRKVDSRSSLGRHSEGNLRIAAYVGLARKIRKGRSRRWSTSERNLSPRRCPRNPRHWRTLGQRKFSRPSTATRLQAGQEYFSIWFLPHLLEINNHLYTFSAVGTNEEVVGMESNRHGGMERNRHGWSDYRLASLHSLRGGSAESSIRRGCAFGDSELRARPSDSGKSHRPKYPPLNGGNLLLLGRQRRKEEALQRAVPVSPLQTCRCCVRSLFIAVNREVVHPRAVVHVVDVMFTKQLSHVHAIR